MRKIVYLCAVAAVLVVLAALVRTLTLPSLQPSTQPAAANTCVNADAAAQRLARALTFATVAGPKADANAFLGLTTFLTQDAYSKLGDQLEVEKVGGHSLLYTWRGLKPELPGVLFLAHLDVVPAESPESWQHPPFGGHIAEGFVWGRGAMDFKMGVTGLLEATQCLMQSGFRPQRTVYLAMGEDEEVGGHVGAAKIAALLQERGVRLSAVLDEGMVVTQNMMPGIQRPVALIGIAEKGYMSVTLSTHEEGGHSSMPPTQTAVSRMSAAIMQISTHPMPATLDGPVAELLRFTAPEMGFGMRLVMGNAWLFGPVIKAVLTAKPASNALVRTTFAPTLFNAGVQDNVLAQDASATVNVRIRPGDTEDNVLRHLESAMDDSRITLQRHREGLAGPPSVVSSSQSPAFNALAQAVVQTIPNAVVAPSLFLGATDSRHFRNLADNIYRFSPQRMSPEDRPRFHGINERLSVESYVEAIHVYMRTIEQWSAAPP